MGKGAEGISSSSPSLVPPSVSEHFAGEVLGLEPLPMSSLPVRSMGEAPSQAPQVKHSEVWGGRAVG